jgi:hypothetical protein
LRQELKVGRPGRTQDYHDETRTARYLLSDGELVLCFSVIGISLQQSAAILAECTAIASWDETAFHAAIGRALGGAVEHVH